MMLLFCVGISEDSAATSANKQMSFTKQNSARATMEGRNNQMLYEHEEK